MEILNLKCYSSYLLVFCCAAHSKSTAEQSKCNFKLPLIVIDVDLNHLMRQMKINSAHGWIIKAFSFVFGFNIILHLLENLFSFTFLCISRFVDIQNILVVFFVISL